MSNYHIVLDNNAQVVIFGEGQSGGWALYN